MKTTFRTLLLMTFSSLLLICFSSCGNDDSTPEINDGKVKFTSGNVATPQQRIGGTDGNQWEGNESIGIYMIEHGQALSTLSIKDGGDNVKYSTTSIGTSASFVSGTTSIYYPVNGSLVDFRAYHPYSSTAIEDNGNYWYEFDVLDQSNQSAIDLMTASANNNGTGYSKADVAAVNLHFQHRLAKIIINVAAGDGVSSLSGLDVKVKGMAHVIIFDLINFSFVGIGEENNSVMTPYSAGNNIYELILPPTELNDLSEYKVEFTVDGNTYVWTMSENSSDILYLESGEKYTFDVTLTKNKVLVSGTISPWTPVDGDTGIAN